MKNLIKTSIWISVVFLCKLHILHAFPISYVQDLNVGYESEVFFKYNFGYEPSPFKDFGYYGITYTDDTVYFYFKDLVIPQHVFMGGMKLGNTNLMGGFSFNFFSTVSSTSLKEISPLKSKGYGFSLISKWQPYAGKRLLLGIESSFGVEGIEISDDSYLNFAFSLCPSIKLRKSKNFSIYVTPSLFTSHFSSDSLEPPINITTQGLSISGGIVYNLFNILPSSSELGLLFTNKGNSVFFTVSFTLPYCNHGFEEFKDIFYGAQHAFEETNYEDALRLYNGILIDYQKWDRYGELSSSCTSIGELKTKIEFCKAKIKERHEKEAKLLFQEALRKESINDLSSAEKLCLKISTQYPDTKISAESQTLLEKIKRVKEQREKTASKMLEQAKVNFRNGYYVSAKKSCVEILDKYEETDSAAEAHTLLEKSENALQDAITRAALKSRRELVLSNILYKYGFTNLKIAYIGYGLANIKPENGAIIIIEGLGMSLGLFDAIAEFRRLTPYQKLYAALFTAERIATVTTGDTKGSTFLYLKEQLLYDWIPLSRSVISRLAMIPSDEL